MAIVRPMPRPFSFRENSGSKIRSAIFGEIPGTVVGEKQIELGQPEQVFHRFVVDGPCAVRRFEKLRVSVAADIHETDVTVVIFRYQA